MKKWECSVCGYIHNDVMPPQNCPVCNADQSLFILLENETEINDKTNYATDLDIAIVGSGVAGLTAAITAHLDGFKVAIFEKADKVGGTSKRSGGRIWVPGNLKQIEHGLLDNKQDCLRYFVRIAYPETYDPGLDFLGIDESKYNKILSYIDNAKVMIDYLEKNKVLKYDIDINHNNEAYTDYVENIVENKSIRGRSVVTLDKDSKPQMGNGLVKLLHDFLIKEKVEIHLESRVEDIILENNQVKAIVVNNQIVKTKEGVIFGSGGFSKNKDLMERFQTGIHYGGCAVKENTGDLVEIAQKHNLPLGHMNNAFRAQSILDFYRANPDGSSNMFYTVGDSVIQVNKFGKRVMNEKRGYNDRTMKHFVFDENYAGYPNRFMYLIFDQRTAEMWAGFPPYSATNIADAPHVLSGETIDELSEHLALHIGDIGHTIKDYVLDDDFNENLKETVERFNEFARTGVDKDFKRGESNYDLEYPTFPPTNPNTKHKLNTSKNPSMYPISDKGPYYAIILAAGTLDTNGGVITNEHGQILNNNNEVIKGLYGAGNCICGIGRNSYAGAGATLGPAMTYGYLAVKDIKNKQ
ncbi:FAD-dependent oxidoreductase [Mycoplasma sp. P36-A1]|uniref:FAD-dependent oxidoreductase n=1 Tax=Mycoplasma sp. P36-A1 TaxID=3252900 RepID=UPI003C303911